MAPRPNERQKRFAELIHQGKPTSQAHRMAGYKPCSWNPYRNLKKPAVQAHLRKLEARTMRKYDITVEKILTDLEEARELAKQQRLPAAMISASMASAKMVGLAPDKVEVKQIDDMDLVELARHVRETLGEAADPVLKMLGLDADAPPVAPEEPKWETFPATGTVQ